MCLQGGETTADLLQRGFARYGDNSGKIVNLEDEELRKIISLITGSRTSKNSTKAAKKLDKYHLAVGRLQ